MTSRTAGALAPILIVLGSFGPAASQDDPIAVSSEDGDSEETRPWGQVVTEPDAASGLKADDFELNAAALAGDTLAVTVSYGGGCEEHLFTLDASGAFLESDPVQLALSLAHDANNDSCERWVTQEYLFDLSPLSARYEEEYQQASGAIVLRLDAVSDDLLYEFPAAAGTAVKDLSWGRIKTSVGR